jgi:hypothetical protein
MLDFVGFSRFVDGWRGGGRGMKACRCVGEEGVWVKVGRFIIASKQSNLYRKVN